MVYTIYNEEFKLGWFFMSNKRYRWRFRMFGILKSEK